MLAIALQAAATAAAAGPADLSARAIQPLNQARAELGQGAEQNLTLENLTSSLPGNLSAQNLTLGNVTANLPANLTPGQISQNLNETKAQLKRSAARRLEQTFNNTAEQLHQGINNTTEHFQEEAQNEFHSQVEKRTQPGMGAALAMLGLMAVFCILGRH